MPISLWDAAMSEAREAIVLALCEQAGMTRRAAFRLIRAVEWGEA